MVIFETLRHFVQEWIRIQRPKDESREWPWDKTSALWLLNLYAIPGDEIQRELRTPFISILVDGCTTPNYGLQPSDPHCYSHYFIGDGSDDEFQYPRRYIFDPFGQGSSNVRFRRFSFHSNHYTEEQNKYDMELQRMLTRRANYRYSIYNSHYYALITERLKELEDASAKETGVRNPIQYAENLLDVTTSAKKFNTVPPSPDTMLLQIPISGIIPQIKKSNSYRIINGSLVIPDDQVIGALPWESSYREYLKMMNPFFEKSGKPLENTCAPGYCKSVVYLAIECQANTFYFNESFPSILFKGVKEDENGKNVGMAYMVSHHFNMVPSTTNPHASYVYPKLAHSIIEGAIPNDHYHRRFIEKDNAILFKRSDMPPGYRKIKGGTAVSVDISIT